MDKIQIFSIIVSLILLFTILRLVKTKHLLIKYSLLWLITGFVLLILSFSRSLLEKLAEWVGIHYPPSLIFLLGFLFSLAILLHFSVVISRLTEQNKELAQRISLLEVERWEKGA